MKSGWFELEMHPSTWSSAKQNQSENVFNICNIYFCFSFSPLANSDISCVQWTVKRTEIGTERKRGDLQHMTRYILLRLSSPRIFSSQSDLTVNKSPERFTMYYVRSLSVVYVMIFFPLICSMCSWRNNLLYGIISCI